MTERRLLIERLGRRGEGVAEGPDGIVYVPYALPGEQVLADVEGERGRLIEIETPRTDRIAPICSYFGRCGGCAVQALPPEPYAAWKRDLVITALSHAGVAADVAAILDGHGAGRRRATFHARAGRDGRSRVGFMAARSHDIVEIDACPVLAPEMAGAVGAAARLAKVLSGGGKPLDILVTSTETGLDVDLHGHGPLDEPLRRRLVVAAGDLGLARLANHGDVLVEAKTPRLHFGAAAITPPPGAFLQATQRGEDILAEIVLGAVAGARKVADLFCGTGTFALRIAETAPVQAFDYDGPGIQALIRAAQSTLSLKGLDATPRDLVKRPLRPDELAAFDALVFDPPRAGAAAQATEIARSSVPTVVAVSCDPGTFSRDAASLIAGGYTVGSVTPVDQFRHSAHVEIVAVFRRAAIRKKRRLLS